MVRKGVDGASGAIRKCRQSIYSQKAGAEAGETNLVRKPSFSGLSQGTRWN